MRRTIRCDGVRKDRTLPADRVGYPRDVRRLAVGFLGAERLAVDLFAVERLAVDFRVVALFAVDFFEPDRFAVGFRVVDFFAPPRFAVDFLVVDLFAPARLAVDFFAVDFREVVRRRVGAAAGCSIISSPIAPPASGGIAGGISGGICVEPPMPSVSSIGMRVSSSIVSDIDSSSIVGGPNDPRSIMSDQHKFARAFSAMSSIQTTPVVTRKQPYGRDSDVATTANASRARS
jgi:hypothetical protein